MLKPIRFLSMVIISTLIPCAYGGLLGERELKVVYGEDNRIEVYEAPLALQKVASANAAMIPITSLTKQTPIEDILTPGRVFPALYNTDQDPLSDDGVCKTERFATQPSPAICSAFLVGPDLIVTAGHCARQWSLCERFAFVFNFNVDQKSAMAGMNIPAEDIYKCKKVINAELDNIVGADHALIQLERVVKGVEPLSFRSKGKVDNKSELIVIGHPSGLPTKISGAGSMRVNEHDKFFVANLDTFHGNSGSLVVNGDDYKVEGILVRGEDDYEYSSEKSCDIVKVCKDGDCRGEDVTRITTILELEMRDDLIEASKTGNYEFVTSYLEKKGFVDMYNNQRESLLMIAAQNAQEDIALLLFEKKADIKHLDLAGKTVLHHAVLSEKENFSLVESLIARGIEIDKKDNKEMTALMYAVDALKVEETRVLISGKASLDFRINGENPLIHSVVKNSKDMVQLLLESGMPIENLSSNGMTAMSIAFSSDSVDVANVLLNFGANVNEGNLLVKALKNNQLEMAKLLITRGADLEAKTEDGEGLLISAIQNNSMEQVKILIEGKVNLNQLSLAKVPALELAMDKDMTIAQALIAAGADTNLAASTGESLLMAAVKLQSAEKVALLIEGKANVNEKSNGESIIERAVLNKDLIISAKLKEAGADINVKSANGEGLLINAINDSDVNRAQLLVRLGLDINQMSFAQESSVIAAIRTKNLMMVKAIVEMGGDLDVRSMEGYSPKRLARRLRQKEMRKYLRKEMRKRIVKA